MHKISRLLFLLSLLAAPVALLRARDIGAVDVKVDNAVTVRITGSSPEIQGMAQKAFDAHGRYKVVGSGANFDLKFTAVGPTQVRVDITKGSAATPVASQVVSGHSMSNALMRAADVAVEKTNGLGLRGFFAARLTFISQRSGKGDIYFSDLFLNAAETKQLTHDNALTLTPRWAPDGVHVIYTSYFKSGAPDIFVHDTRGGRQTFVSLRGMNSGARFSPNGQRVAMVLSGSAGIPQIYVSDPQGRQIKPLTQSDAVKSSPCWSPDGSQILFTMEPGPQLYLMSAAGGPVRRLQVGLGTYVAEPDWSRANPSKIACTVRVGARYQIAVYDLSTQQGKVVSAAAFDGIEPSWLGDGRHLVYTARDRKSTVLCILDTETGKSTPITPVQTAALQANVWTP